MSSVSQRLSDRPNSLSTKTSFIFVTLLNLFVGLFISSILFFLPKKLTIKFLILMMRRKIETRNGFYSPNRLSIYKKFKSNDLEISDKISENIICLPLYNALSNKNVKYIAKNFLELID